MNRKRSRTKISVISLNQTSLDLPEEKGFPLRNSYVRSVGGFLLSSRVFGLDFTKTQYSLWSKFIFVLLHVRVVFISCNAIYGGIRGIPLTILFICIWESVTTAVVLASFYHFRRQHDAIWEHVLNITSRYHNLLKNYYSTLKRWSLILGWSVWIGGISITLSILWPLIREPPQGYIDLYLFGIDMTVNTTLPSWVPYIFVAIDSELCTFMSNVSRNLFCVIYCILCLTVRYTFTGLDESIKKKADNMEPKSVATILKDYYTIKELVTSFDSAYAPLVFWWSATIVFDCTFNLYQLLKSFMFDEFSTDWFYYLVRTTYDVSIFLAFCLPASDVTTEAMNAIFSLCRGAYKVDPATIKGAHLLIEEANSNPPHLTGWGLFNMSRGNVLTTMSVVVTYLVILLGMKQG